VPWWLSLGACQLAFLPLTLSGRRSDRARFLLSADLAAN
jgi:hypothetical protein